MVADHYPIGRQMGRIYKSVYFLAFITSLTKIIYRLFLNNYKSINCCRFIVQTNY